MSVYYSRLKSLWDEFETMVPSPACGCEKSKEFLVYLKGYKLYQFLIGLSDSYVQTRRQLLLMNLSAYGESGLCHSCE